MSGKQTWSTLGTAVGLVGLAAVAAFPFLAGDGVPRTNDLVPHLHRAFALHEMISLGYMWPRWAAGLVHGYGYPVFNFFPALSHWLIVVWHLAGLPLLTAYKMTVWTHFVIAAAAAFWLGRSLTGRFIGGWLVALIYTFSPYLLYDALVRGSPPESQALALLPLLVLGVWRLQQPAGPRLPWGLLTAAVYALMILSHHPVILQISLLVGLWVVGYWLLKPTDGRRQITGYRLQTSELVWPLGALLLGGLLSAFFALPALLEIDATRATLSISQGYTYQDNFLPLAELFRWPELPADPARLNPPVVRPLPLVGLAAALLTLPLAWPALDRPRRRLVILLGLSAALATWLITPASAIAWRLVPLLEYTLYPWRMLGWISLMIAMLAGIGLSAVLKGKTVYWFIGLMVIGLVTVEAVPWLFPPREPLPTAITRKIVAEGEQPPFLIGTTTLGEFLPAGVDALPDTGPLKAELIAEDNPDRLLAPEGVSWQRLGPNPLDAHYTISTGVPATITYRQFYFPGWRLSINGQEQQIAPTQPAGLIAFELPAGTHDVQLQFGSTPVRTLAGWLSAAALGVWGLGIGYFVFRPETRGQRQEARDKRPETRDRRQETGDRRRETGDDKTQTSEDYWSTKRQTNDDMKTAKLPTPPPGLWSLISGLLPFIIFTFFWQVDTPLRQPTLQPAGVWGTPVIEPLDFAGELRLLSVKQPSKPVAADDELDLTLYWTALRGIGVDYAFGIQVVDEEGLPWQVAVNRPLDWRFVGGADVWPLGTYRLEPFEITLLDGTPPGSYRFLVGLVRKDTGQTVASHTIGRLIVDRPARGDRPLEAGMIPVGETLYAADLLGIRPDRREARPGDPLRLGLLWRRQSRDSMRFSVQLIDDRGEPVWTSDLLSLPVGSPGDRLRVDWTLRLPASIPAGAYTWQIIAGQEMATAGHLTVNTPDRMFDPPALAHPINARFGDLARLTGFSLAHPTPTSFDLTLGWQATAETTTSYRVFVHLVDEAGTIVAQSDAEPAGWTRPTTGWLPPEFIIDPHNLSIPDDRSASRYILRIGLYDPQTGRRILTDSGLEFVEIEVER